ncbi:hypothetical protein L7F22_064534 [Adiantum nelumboides]|nr:hypothetical protein [Adiantum nelumboides]
MASSQAFSVIPPSSQINASAVLPPPLCLKTSLLPALHRLASFRCACRLRNTFGGLLDSSSLKASPKFNFVDRSLGLRVESVAFVPAAFPAKSSEMPGSHSDTFSTVKTEKELLSGIRKEVEMKRISPRVGYAMEELYWNYRRAVLEGGAPQDKVVQIMATVLDRILLQFEDPFVFPAYHKAIRDPYDYYMFGQNYIRPLLDFRNSYLGNVSTFDEIEGQLKQGENVVFVANHQTEADPAVMALLLETTHPYLSQSLTYIAGDRVVADPFCKPFSMGRNLLCVYSKKHINDEPELIDMKRKANARSLKELALLLRLQELRFEFSHHALVSYWISKADRMNRDFFVAHRERPAGSTMRAIRDTHGVLHIDPDQVLEISSAFYEDLFTADPVTVEWRNFMMLSIC